MILYDVIDYIQSKFDDDDEIETDIEVLESYKYSHKINKAEVQVQVIDHSEFQRFTTFEDGKIYVSPLQFNVYGSQMTIDGEQVSAQKSAYILAQKIINWLNVSQLKEEIPGVISAKNGTYTSAVPLQIGTVLYCSVVRIDLYLEHN